MDVPTDGMGDLEFLAIPHNRISGSAHFGIYTCPMQGPEGPEDVKLEPAVVAMFHYDNPEIEDTYVVVDAKEAIMYAGELLKGAALLYQGEHGEVQGKAMMMQEMMKLMS